MAEDESPAIQSLRLFTSSVPC